MCNYASVFAQEQGLPIGKFSLGYINGTGIFTGCEKKTKIVLTIMGIYDKLINVVAREIKKTLTANRLYVILDKSLR
ncbi:hypothetical protein OH784_00150 [Ectobacillus funiculus]|uniref:hypothetical protein n=1 Tax=Ectobacillus funiculus TaxID=137993 RepID=UPI003979ADFA